MHQGVYEELKRVARSKNVTNYTAIGNMIGLDMGNPVKNPRDVVKLFKK